MSELRYDPMKKAWVIIATERGVRPVNVQKREHLRSCASEAACPFCPGNENRTPPEILAIRDPGSRPNGPGWRIRVLPNKFPALTIESPLERYGEGIYDVVSGFGAHEVVVETPDNLEQMADFSVGHLQDVFGVYRSRLRDLMKDQRFRYIMIFKNHGTEAGASLFHSHSQIIALPVTPNLVAVELASTRDYFQLKERCMLCDIIHQELEDQARIVLVEEKFIVFTPFASSFPYELRVVPRRHSHDFSLVDDDTLAHLAFAIKEVLTLLRKELDDPPFNLILHTAPPFTHRAGKPYYWSSIESDFHWYLELVPRLTMIAGFEWGTGFQINPTSPEDAARFLRESEI
ncbi:MAG: galactose-1-phosphate uridylyltransferase [Proteobacteria bacterium]|nr:galactose-1-phosphate uridylyltransferase [Pseudomonadota bacterium]